MAAVRVHLDELGVERVEILPERGALSGDAFRLAGRLGSTLMALDTAIREHHVRAAGLEPPSGNGREPDGARHGTAL